MAFYNATVVSQLILRHFLCIVGVLISLICRYLALANNMFLLFAEGDTKQITQDVTQCDSQKPTLVSNVSTQDTLKTNAIANQKKTTLESEVSNGEVADTFSSVEKAGPECLTRRQAEVLVALLSSRDQGLQQKALVTIGNAAAFTHNQVS